MVDEVRIGYDLSKGRTIFDMAREVRPDIIALGYDQKPDEKKLEEDMMKIGLKVKVVRISKREDAVK
jgi:FAD synthetase